MMNNHSYLIYLDSPLHPTLFGQTTSSKSQGGESGFSKNCSTASDSVTPFTSYFSLVKDLEAEKPCWTHEGLQTPTCFVYFLKIFK